MDWVVTDRYFYDLADSIILRHKAALIKPLLKIYPRPDYLFVLDAPTEKIMNRNKEQNFSGMSKSPKRVSYGSGLFRKAETEILSLSRSSGWSVKLIRRKKK